MLKRDARGCGRVARHIPLAIGGAMIVLQAPLVVQMKCPANVRLTINIDLQSFL